MQIRPRTGFPETIAVRFNTHNPASPFAVLDLDTYELIVESEAEADKLIKAGCAAKDLHHAHKAQVIAQTGAEHYTPDDAANPVIAVCGTRHASGGWVCTIGKDHTGPHIASKDGTVLSRWPLDSALNVQADAEAQA
jgi:hypothetical protein